MKIKHNTINYSVDTVDALLTLVGEENDVVVVTDENRGGTFIYKSADSATNNGGTIFNGWTRQYDGAVNVKWFGAGTADDTDIIQNIIDNVVTIEIFFPYGTYYLTSLEFGSKNIKVTGEGSQRTTITQLATATAPLIRYGVSDGRYNIGYIENLKLEGVSKTNEGLHLRNTAIAYPRDLLIENFNIGLYMTGCVQVEPENLKIASCNKAVFIRKELAGDTATSRPNLITINSSQLTGNKVAIDFDDGASFKIKDTQIDFNNNEGIGETILIGSNSSTEVGFSKSPTLFLDNVWIEGNNSLNWLRVDNGGVYAENVTSLDNNGVAFCNHNNPITLINCTGATTGDTFKILDTNKFGTFINCLFQAEITGTNSTQTPTSNNPYWNIINSLNNSEGYVGKPAFSAYTITTEVMTSATYKKVPLGFTEYDKNGDFDTTSYSFIAPMNGLYHFDATAWIEGTISRAQIALYKNGSLFKVGNYFIGTFTEVHPTISADMVLNEGDVIELYTLAYGSSLLLRGSNKTTYLNSHLILGA